MRNRRNVLIAFLLCACLIVGVGYAALSTELYLNGSASLSEEYMQELFDSKITWISAVSDDETQVTTLISDGNDTITINANNLKTVGEPVQVVCTMKNASLDLTATVTEPVLQIVEKVAGDAAYFDIQVSALSDTELAPQESATVIVTFKLKQSFVPSTEKEMVQVDFNLVYNIVSVS